MDKIKQYWSIFIGKVVAHPVAAGIVIAALALAVVIAALA